MPLEQSRILGAAPVEEHDLKGRLQLIGLAVAAALAWRGVHSIPGWHGVRSMVGRRVAGEQVTAVSELEVTEVCRMNDRGDWEIKRSVGATRIKRILSP